MDNVFAQIKTTELKGSTFRSRILDFGDFDISGAEFKIVFKKAGNILPLTDFAPQKIENRLVIPYNILESYSSEIRMEAWMTLDGVTDLALVDTMLISAENQLKSDTTNQNVSVTFGDVVIPVTFTQAIVNIGGGTGIATWESIQNKPAQFPPENHTHSYNDLNDKPTIPQPVDISGKQDALVSGTNIKTVNGESILGAGNIQIQSSGDSALQTTPEPTFSIEDENGNSAFSISEDGKTTVKDFSEETKMQISDFVLAQVPEPEAPTATATVAKETNLDNYADINHVITYGQSLSVGQTEVVLTTSALFPNLVNFDGVTRTSPYDKSLTGDTYPTNRRLSFVPITERVNDGTSPGPLRETPTSGTLESLALEINKFSPVQFPTLPMKLLGSAPGWGATTVNQLSKGSSYYTQLIADVTAGKTLANAADKIYKVLAVTWTQGESDYLGSTTSTDYKAAMITLRNNLNTDIKAITGQTDDIAFVMYQTGASNAKPYPNIALAQYDLAMNNDGFYMATAMYQMKYNDTFHLKSESSKLLGAYYGFVINKIISGGEKWKPLHPKSHLIQGNICKLKFEVPKAPLQFQAANTVTLANKGFAVIKGGTDILTSVSIGDDGVSVNLKCSADPAGALIQYGVNVTLTPGGTASSKVNMGNLSDSQGNTQTFNIAGTDLKMDNWSPIFEYQL